MKLNVKHIGLLAGLFVAVGSLVSTATAAPKPFSIVKVYPNSNNAVINQVNTYFYSLRNNQTNPVSLQISALSPLLHIDPKLSTCTHSLPAGGVCKLVLHLDGINKLGPLSTALAITTGNNQVVKLPLNYHVIAKLGAADSNNGRWHSFNGPFGGDIMDVVAAPNNPQILYAAAPEAGGVYQSTDGGNHWQSISTNLKVPTVTQLLLDQDALYAVIQGDGVYKTTQPGGQWTKVASGVFALAASNTGSADTLYAGINFALLKSTDGGAHWTTTKFGHSANALLAEGNVVYAFSSDSNSQGLYKSIDGGNTWTLANNGLPVRGINTLSEVNGVLYAGCENVDGSGALFKSTNRGQSWFPADNGLDHLWVSGIAAAGNTLYVSTSSLYSGQSGGIYQSTNGGASWSAINSGILDLFSNSITVVGSTLYAGTNDGVYKSIDNGLNWSQINTGINGYVVTHMLAMSDGSLYVGTLSGEVFKSSDLGSTWSLMQGIDPTNSVGIRGMVADQDGNIYVNSAGAGIYTSSDNGQSWHGVPLPQGSGLTVFPSSMLVTNTTVPVHASTFYIGTESGDGIYFTNNGGASWQSINSDIEDNPDNILGMAVIGNTIFAQPDDGSIAKISLSNQGMWSQLNMYAQNTNSIAAITNVLYLMTQQGVYVSYDLGQTLFRQNSLPTNANVLSLLPLTPMNWLAATNNLGIYQSFDGGKTWQADNSGIGNNYQATNLVTGGNYIYTMTNQGLYWSTTAGH